MILYIVRHGIAVDRTDPNSPPEPERPLTATGVKKTRLAALGVATMAIKPDVFITSPLIRAVQTAEIFAEALGFAPNKIRTSEALQPAANPADFLKELARLKAKEAMCFGHAPHLDTLISQLAGARGVFTSLKKAGIACFEHGASRDGWELLWLVTPKVLRQLAE
ncbi:MAG: phosphohistidine phosphatase SixA [Candidatus Acidiferrales bacterium]